VTVPNEDMLYINGIDGATGQYLLSPMTYDQAASYVRGQPHDTPLLRFLKGIWDVIRQPSLGLPFGTRPEDVTQAGWGVVFHKDEDPQVRQALEPLVEHRRQEIGNDAIVKVLEYDGQPDAHDWLADHQVAPADVLPWRVPYYLLLVGSPEQIPFSFGHLLDVEYAVGRLHFERVSHYKQYVQGLLEYEAGQAPPRAKEAVFFGTRHRFDKATQISADLLIDPLADGIPADGADPSQDGAADAMGFRTRKLREEAATKEALSGIMAPPPGSIPPALLFSATHGVGFREPRDDQVEKHGALVCQDWPGFGTFGEEHCFAARDLPADSRVHGLIAFLFACYGGGTPSHDRFIHLPGQPPLRIADQAFLAALPKALLGHPLGGALACIGHVERAWSYSITMPKIGPQLLPFQNAVKRILAGEPVGYAMKDFNERYAALNARQSQLLEEISFGAQVSDEELATNWAWRNDAEGYIVIGDPAVRLRVDDLV
jgi:hypothetical protein